MSHENNIFSEVDHTELFKSIVGDGPFDDFYTFEENFKRFQKETSTVFNKCAGSSVYYENKRRKRHVAEKFQYVSIRFQCIHYGEPKPKSTGQRPKQKYLPCGCKAAFRLVYRKKALYVTASNLVHQNHIIDLATAKSYPKYRRLNEAQEKDITPLMEVDDKCGVQKYLETHYDKCFTTKDIANLKQKRRHNLSMAQRWEKADEIVRRVNQALRDGERSQFISRVAQFEELLESMEHVDESTSVTTPCVSIASVPVKSFISNTPLQTIPVVGELCDNDKDNIITVHRVGYEFIDTGTNNN